MRAESSAAQETDFFSTGDSEGQAWDHSETQAATQYAAGGAPPKLKALSLVSESSASKSNRQATKLSNLHSRISGGGGKSMVSRAMTQDLGKLNTMEEDLELWQALHIMPDAPWLEKWFVLTVLAALVAGWVEPFTMAFINPPNVGNRHGVWVALEWLTPAVFCSDIVMRFFIAYQHPDTGETVCSHRNIAARYARGPLIFHLVSSIPWNLIALAASPARSSPEQQGAQLGLLKLLQLLQMYRVLEAFSLLEYNMTISQMLLMLIRNYTYVFFCTHWAACTFYHIATLERLSGLVSWVGRAKLRFDGASVMIRYVYSLYFSIGSFTGLGDGDFYEASVYEAGFMIVYLLINLVLGAYILGTVTLLVVKSDKRSKVFRDRMTNLALFSDTNELPPALNKSMQEHLELHFHGEEASDETVLGIYPATIKRKVLRHLYLVPVKSAYVFKSCKLKFLDAVLAAARLEVFMPGVHILAEGETVNELFIIVAGTVELRRKAEDVHHNSAPAQSYTLKAKHADAVVVDPMAADLADNRGLHEQAVSKKESLFRKDTGDPDASEQRGILRFVSGLSKTDKRGGDDAFKRQATSHLSEADMEDETLTASLSSGNTFGEVPFFTEAGSEQSVVSQSIVRVMVLSKVAFEALSASFPQQTRLVLENLLHRCNDNLVKELRPAAHRCNMHTAQHKDIVTVCKGDEDMIAALPDDFVHKVSRTLTPLCQARIARLDSVRQTVRGHVARVDQMRTFEFLAAASAGEADKLRVLLAQGMSPDSADYDGRNGLMLACHEGHESVVKMLLDAGADHRLKDNLGNTAMSEAVKSNMDKIIDIMLGYGAKLGIDGVMVAAQMCTCVFDGDLVMLRRLLKAGADPDSADYDKRCPLHISAAEGNLTAVKVMIEEGKATPGFQDRWGNTALDEARRVGAASVVAYLEPLISQSEVADGVQKWKHQRTLDFLEACSEGAIGQVRYMLMNAKPTSLATGLLVAAARGHLELVQLLLAWSGKELLQLDAGYTALLEASREGHAKVVGELRDSGVKLDAGERPALMLTLAAAIYESDIPFLQQLLAAGVEADMKDPGGNAPLHTAVLVANLSAVRVLVEEAKCSLAVTDRSGNTPLQLAKLQVTASPGGNSKRVLEYLEWVTALSTGSDIGVEAVTCWGVIGAEEAAVAAVDPERDEFEAAAAALADQYAGLMGPTTAILSGDPFKEPPGMSPRACNRARRISTLGPPGVGRTTSIDRPVSRSEENSKARRASYVQLGGGALRNRRRSSLVDARTSMEAEPSSPTHGGSGFRLTPGGRMGLTDSNGAQAALSPRHTTTNYPANQAGHSPLPHPRAAALVALEAEIAANYGSSGSDLRQVSSSGVNEINEAAAATHAAAADVLRSFQATPVTGRRGSALSSVDLPRSLRGSTSSVVGDLRNNSVDGEIMESIDSLFGSRSGHAPVVGDGAAATMPWALSGSHRSIRDAEAALSGGRSMNGRSPDPLAACAITERLSSASQGGSWPRVTSPDGVPPKLPGSPDVEPSHSRFLTTGLGSNTAPRSRSQQSGLVPGSISQVQLQMLSRSPTDEGAPGANGIAGRSMHSSSGRVVSAGGSVPPLQLRISGMVDGGAYEGSANGVLSGMTGSVGPIYNSSRLSNGGLSPRVSNAQHGFPGEFLLPPGSPGRDFSMQRSGLAQVQGLVSRTGAGNEHSMAPPVMPRPPSSTLGSGGQGSGRASIRQGLSHLNNIPSSASSLLQAAVQGGGISPLVESEPQGWSGDANIRSSSSEVMSPTTGASAMSGGSDSTRGAALL